ncbi:TPA: hypothetical protein I6W77_003201 [Vibrio cholerae]|nr:hypothetical protein [Vibrio cholerae]HBC2020469.1 hypothetical protein [Vibrio cholerae]
MEEKHMAYASNQVSALLCNPKYMLCIFILSLLGLSGYLVRVLWGEQYAWASLLSTTVMSIGSILLALHLHKKAGSPSPEELLDE